MDITEGVETFTPFKDRKDWVARYNKLYSASIFSIPEEGTSHDPHHITFLTNITIDNSSLTLKLKDPHRRESQLKHPVLLSEKTNEEPSSNEPKNETKLLDMVRELKRQVAIEKHDDTNLHSPPSSKHPSEDDTQGSEVFIPTFNHRTTDRSISRQSRTSRVSTRRDMDIPTLLAFTPSEDNLPKTALEIPAFTNIKKPEVEDIPKWSTRRALCAACSQRWKDKSSIAKVKSSGLKKNSASEMASIIAPGRLRTAITLGRIYRPAIVDEDKRFTHRALRNTTAPSSWQFTRARLFRVPKPKPPPPEATVLPQGATSLTQKDLDSRVNKFLNDEFDKAKNKSELR